MLYFAYTARISPTSMAEAAPGAEFQFIAHLPEWSLEFPIESRDWNGSLPAVKPAPGQTVWGAVFAVPDSDVESLNDVEGGEQRRVSTAEAIDRSGKRHEVTVHVRDVDGNGSHRPSSDYLQIMLHGSRHWSLPAGWIAGLEEHLGAD